MKSALRHRSPLLALYVFRRILLPSCVLVVVLLAILSLERVLRLLQLVTENGQPVSKTLGLVVYLLPHYLGLAMPAGLFMGTLLAVRGLHERSELVAMRGFGMTMRRMQIPVFTLAAFMSMVLLAVTGFAQPYGRHAYRQHVAKLATGNLLVGLQNGMFHKVGEDITIRVDQVAPDGLTFDGFFMTMEQNRGERMILTAETGQLVPQGDDALGVAVKLDLSHGTYLIERDSTKGKEGRGDRFDKKGKAIIFQMGFGRAPLSIPMDRVVKNFGPRGNDERELTLPELFAGGIPGRVIDATPAKIEAELHARLVNIFSLPVLALLATPLALIGQGRGRRASGIAVAVVVFVVYQKLSGLGQGMAEDGKISSLVGLWSPWLALLIFTFFMFHLYSGDSGRSVLDVIAGTLRKSSKRGTLPQSARES